jgi:hypothetical protein
LSDADDAGAIRFYSVPWQGDRGLGRSAGVRVQAAGMDGAGAGLIYAIRDEYPRWAALIVTPDKSVAIVARQATGLSEVKRMPIPGGPHAEGELLQISERGGVTTMLANGVEVAHFNMATNGAAPVAGPVGIVAIGPGRFSYGGFAFGQEVLAQAPGDDRVPARSAPVAGNDDRVPAPVRGSAPATPVADGRRWQVPQLDPLAANVLGATMGIVAHEIGHFVIGELKIPATGPEEDVADEFAAMVFVDNMRDMPEQAGSMALSMAKVWWYSAEDHGDAQQPEWFDEHAPDRARFGRIMCMLYGASPRNFEPVMEQTGIPERTRARCIDDERKRHLAWDSLLRSHRRRGVDAVMPGDLDPATPGKRMNVVFEAPKTQAYAPLRVFLERSRMLDTAGDLMSRLYVLPRDTKLVVRECGDTNAFYNSDDGSVNLCYEMVAWVLATFAKHEGVSGPVAGDATPAQPMPSQPMPSQPAPSRPAGTPAGPPPPATTFNIAAFLEGSWRLKTTEDKGVTDDILVQASADGTYRGRHDVSIPNADHVTIGVVGRWSAEATANPRTYNLVLTPQQWSPRQICGKGGSCAPLDLDETRITVQIKDRNTLVSDQGQVTRVE